jgi:MSHA pilin protein MshD
MRIDRQLTHYKKLARGFSLIELITFMVIISIIIITLASVFKHSMSSMGSPIIRNQLLSFAESQMQTVMARKFDEATPNNGTPCGLAVSCVGIGLEGSETLADTVTLDDIDDFNGYRDQPRPGYDREVQVNYAGTVFGINQEFVKQVTVSVSAQNGETVSLSAYKVNH